MRCGISYSQTVKKRKFWLIKALDRCSQRTIAWVLGSRDSATFRRLYDKVKHLKGCIFFTDSWDAFAEVLPPDRHIIGKSATHAIERDNSNTRHHLGRFTRRTKVVSKSSFMVDITIRLWCALTKPEIFKLWQNQMLYIFKWTLSITVIGYARFETGKPVGKVTHWQRLPLLNFRY